MATVSTLIGGRIPGVDLGPDNSISSIVLSTASIFAWWTPEHNLISLMGNFTYSAPGSTPGGRVSQMTYDTNSDSSVDMTVDYGVAAIAVAPDMFSADAGLWAGAFFSGNDTMTFYNASLEGPGALSGSRFAADGSGFQSERESPQSDNLLINVNGTFCGDVSSTSTNNYVSGDDSFLIQRTTATVQGLSITGDVYSTSANNAVAATLFMGADSITESGAPPQETGDYVIMMGDIHTIDDVTSLLTVHCGNDTITTAAHDDTVVSGDVYTVEGESNIVYCGADDISVDSYGNALFSRTVAVGDVNYVIGGGNTLIAGNDIIHGGTGSDTLIGDIQELRTGNILAPGDDTIFGGEGADTIYGDFATLAVGAILRAGGNDNLDGGAGADVIYGQRGADILTGGAGDDQLFGGLGDDILAGGPDTDSFDGGAGSDTIDYTNTSIALAVDMVAGSAVTSATAETFVDVENFILGSAADVFTGDDFDNVVAGEQGADQLNGGLGSDTADYRNSGGSNVNVNLLTDTASGGYAQGDTLDNIENLYGSRTRRDILVGNNGDNVLYGFGGADSLRGEGGDDFIEGGAGGDAINAGAGVHDIASYRGSSSGQVNINLLTSIYSGGDAQGDTLFFVEDLEGSLTRRDILVGNDTPNTITGNGGDDSIRGEGGNDIIEGGEGGDGLNAGGGIDTVIYERSRAGVTINLSVAVQTSLGEAEGDSLNFFENVNGSAFADDITGNYQANRLVGNAGADTLNGGTGSDYLTGGTDADTFRFSDAGFGTDSITDWEDGTDVISIALPLATQFLNLNFQNNGTADVTVRGFIGGGAIVVHSAVAFTLDAADFVFI